MIISKPSRVLVCSIVVAWGAFAILAAAQQNTSTSERVVEPPFLVNAHAHNDYLHPRPLLDALEQGFASVEADVFLVDGKLLVAHSILEIRKDRTLEDLYLKPLATRCETHGGRVYGAGQELLLLIDLKSAAEPTYQALTDALTPYSELLTRYEDGKIVQSAIRVIVSGNRPIELIARQNKRLAFLDGRLNDLADNSPVELVPLVSDQWSKHFKWQGRGEMPSDEKQKLGEIVSQAHLQQRKIRFWGVPDNESTWQQLLLADVDLINTDKLAELAKFLRSQP